MTHTIAIVEDDDDQRQNYSDALRRRGYQIRSFANRPEALAAMRQELPDLAIVDIMLADEPDGGFDLCRELLALAPALPIIFLTDRIEEIDQVSGLRMGAWDYQSKPVSLNFLAEKIATLFRIIEQRQTQADSDTALSRGSLRIDEGTMQAHWHGHLLDLTLTEFRLLLALVRRPNHVIRYEQLMEATLQSVVTRNTVNTHIMNLRRKITRHDAHFDAIHSEYGMGYRWLEHQQH